jgi:hypothetical protein
MNRSDWSILIVLPIFIILIITLMGITTTYPRSVTGQVTATSETYFPSASTTIYIKTLNGSDYGLSIVAMGIDLPIKIGSTYKITTSWFNSLVSIVEISTV